MQCTKKSICLCSSEFLLYKIIDVHLKSPIALPIKDSKISPITIMPPQIKISDIASLSDNLLAFSDLENTTSLPQHQIGRQVKVISYIASGSHGTTVFKVQAKNGNFYAAKIIPAAKDLVPREELIMQFSRFRTDHPGRNYIISLYATANLVSSTILSARILFYEYADTDLMAFRENLHERREDIPEGLVLQFLTQIALALDLLSSNAAQTSSKKQSQDAPLQRRESNRLQRAASTVMGALRRSASAKGSRPPSRHSVSQSSAPPDTTELVPIIIHGDIKPDNVFLKWHDDDPEHKNWPDIKIADFGLAKTIDVDMTSKLSCNVSVKSESGLAPWAAPEWPRHSAKSDLWSLVHILYDIMQRGLPARAFKIYGHQHVFPRDEYDPLDEVDDFELHDHRTPILVRPLKLHYSQDLDKLIRWALTEDFEQRPTAQQLLKRLSDPEFRVQERITLGFRPLPKWAGQMRE